MELNVLLWYMVIVAAELLGIIQIYGFYQFWSLRSALVIMKRYPKMIMTESIVVVVHLCVLGPFLSNAALCASNFGSKSAEKYLCGPRSIIFLCAPPIVFLIFILEISRLWLISYNLHYLKASKNEKWKSLIDQNIANKNWYIRNKNTFGNQKRVVVAAMICWFFVVAIIDIGFYIHYDFGTMLIGFFTFSGMMTTAYIYYRCRSYKTLQDNLLFYYEFRATVIIWAIGIILSLIAEFMRMLSRDDPSMWIISQNVNGYCSIFALCAPSLLSTIWIPYKFKSTGHRKFSEALVMKLSKSTEMSQVDDSEPSTRYAVDKDLFETLRNEQKFEAFIRFMFRDFSSEAMLGYIEIVQFKEFFVQEMEINDDIDCPYVNSLYEKVPKSAIVYDDKSDKTGIEKMEEIASQLCEKYIRIGSEYEVNISFKLRKKIIALNDSHWSMDTKDFLFVFDRVLDDLFTFMKQSYERYSTYQMDE